MYESRKDRRFLGFIGNFLEHYDNALFGLIAPFIAPLLYPNESASKALIWTYAIMALGILSRPLGALFFGWMGDKYGCNLALFYSLFAMAFTSMAMGFIPLGQKWIIAPSLLFALGKMIQNFCAAGETSGGAIYVLERTETNKKGFLSSLYDSSSLAGILFASTLVTFLSSKDRLLDSWRYLYWIGGLTAIIGVYLRFIDNFKLPANSLKPSIRHNWITTLIAHRSSFLKIVLVSGFSYTTYAFGFTLMNGYIPLVTNFSKQQVIQINTALLLVDMLLLPCFGYLASKVGKGQVMFYGALFSTLSALPLFLLFSGASKPLIALIRLGLVVPGIAFAAPYYAWALENIPKEHRYLILSFGSAVGSQLIGSTSASISLWFYDQTGWIGAPALYLIAIGIAACWQTIPFSRPKLITTS